MPFEHANEAQRLVEHYRQMYDAELENLAAGFEDLTDAAKVALRDEMKRRGLGEPGRPQPQRFPSPNSNQLANRQQPRNFDPSVRENEDPEDGEPVEFTWKTEPCTCNDWHQGQLLRDALYRAGIESWTEPPYARNYGRDFRILVAADQLDEALKIAEKPIPEHVVEESKAPIPEYEAPNCPRCGAADTLLEAVDNVNAWACEACGARWTDTEEQPDSLPGGSQ